MKKKERRSQTGNEIIGGESGNRTDRERVRERRRERERERERNTQQEGA